jgi:hypothetical protein
LTPKDGVGNSKPKLTLTSNGDFFNNGVSNRSITVVWITVKVRLKIRIAIVLFTRVQLRSKVVVPGTPVMTDIGIYNLSVKENKKTGQARSCWGSSLR